MDFLWLIEKKANLFIVDGGWVFLCVSKDEATIFLRNVRCSLIVLFVNGECFFLADEYHLVSIVFCNCPF